MFFLAAEEVDQSMVIAIACVFSFVGIAGGVFVNNYIAKLKHGEQEPAPYEIVCNPIRSLFSHNVYHP